MLALACKGSSDPSPTTGAAPATPTSAGIANTGADEGPAQPQLWIEVARPTEDDVGAVRFTADGRWLLSLDRELTVWDFDASARSLRDRGWFGLAADRVRPDIGALTPENAFAVQEQIERWKQTHESIEDFELLPDGVVVGGGGDGTLAMWRLQPERDPVAERIAMLPAVHERIESVDASPDGRWLLTMGMPTDAQKAARPPAGGDDWEGIVQLWRIDPAGSEAFVAGEHVLVDERPSEGFFTADGRHVVVRASNQGLFVLALDGRGGLRLVSQQELDRTLQDFAMAPDGKTVLSAGSDHTVRTWTVRAAGESVELDLGRVFHHHRAKVRDVVVAPDGRWCLASSPDKTISIWPIAGVAEGDIPQPIVFSASDDYVYGVDIHPHGPWIATAGDEIRIWRVNRELLAAGAGRQKSTVVRRWDLGPSTAPVLAAAWADEDTLVTLDAMRAVRRSRIGAEARSTPHVELESREPTLAAVAVGSDAFARGAPAGAVELVAAADGTSKRIGALDGDEVTAIAAARDCIVTAHASGRVATWTRSALVADVPPMTPAFASASAVALATDASLGVIAGTTTEEHRVLRLFALDASTCTATAVGEPVRPPPTPSGDVMSSSSYPDGRGGVPRVAAFAPNDQWLATAEGEGAGALLWRVDAATRTLVHVGLLDGHDSGADAIAFAPDGRHVVTAGDDGEMVLHRLDLAAQPPIVRRIEYLPPGSRSWFSRALAWSPSGRRLVAVGGWHVHGRAWVFELEPARAE